MAYDLKNEEEVKEFIENLGTEYRFGCFSEKNPEVCHLLGDYLEAIKKDYAKAAKIYKSNCDDYNYPKSCNSYAAYSLLGKGLDKENHDVAYEYFTKGCDLGVPNSCFHAGLMCVANNENIQREKDYTKGLAFLEKACNMNFEHSCYYLSGIYISGSKDQVVKRDMTQAFKYSKKACDLGNMYACTNLSIMYRKGDGVEKNEELSEKFKNKALALQDEVKSKITLEFQRGSDGKV